MQELKSHTLPYLNELQFRHTYLTHNLRLGHATPVTCCDLFLLLLKAGEECCSYNCKAAQMTEIEEVLADKSSHPFLRSLMVRLLPLVLSMDRLAPRWLVHNDAHSQQGDSCRFGGALLRRVPPCADCSVVAEPQALRLVPRRVGM